MPSFSNESTPNSNTSRDSLSQTNTAILRRNMQSLLNRGKAFLTPTSSSANLAKQRTASAGFTTAKGPTDLFPTVDPAIDGEECLHDCSSCTISLPRKWEIDEADVLYGHVKGWDTHVIVATGKTDWVRDVADEKGSLMEAVAGYGLERANGKVMLSASDMPTGQEHEADSSGNSVYAVDGRTRCLVLPKWKMVEGVGKGEVPWLMDEVIGKGATNISPLKWKEDKPEEVQLEQPTQNGHANGDETPNISDLTISQNPSTKIPSSLPDTLVPPSGITLKTCPHRAIILMCSHKTRDWRCGASAPLLRRELERHLRPLGLYRDLHDDRPGGVGIYFINHVGGHKYSANVMVYRRAPSSTTSTITTSNPPSKRQRRQSTAEMVSGAEQINGPAQTSSNGVIDQTSEEELTDEAVQGIWLARVRPEDCENIIKYTVLQGKVVKPTRQLRGGFDRGKGVISW